MVLRENTPGATTRKGAIRIAMERRLEAARAEGVRSLILRAGDSLVHGEVIGRRLVTEASARFVREFEYAMARRRELFSSDGAVIESAMDGLWRHTENGSGLPDRHQFSLGRFGRWPEAWDFPMTAQIADSVGVKTMTICTGSALPVENAGDDSVRIMS